MGRTWKDEKTIGTFFNEKFEKKIDFLTYFYNEHSWLINILTKNGVQIDFLDEGEKLRLKFGNWEQNYFPLSGENNLPGSHNEIISKKMDIIVPNKEYLRVNEKVLPKKIIINRTKLNKEKIEKLISPISRKEVWTKKNYNKYTTFIDFVENFTKRTPIKPTEDTYFRDNLNKNLISNEDEGTKTAFIIDVNSEIINYLKKHPDFIYNISSRKFEEIIAHILKSFGFDVELTKMTRDGGRDIIAYIRNSVCSFLTFVECKHYSISNPVGVGIIREVYGVQQLHKANKSLIVTSSYFTKDAIEERKIISNDLELKDHNDIKIWLEKMK